MCKFVLLKDTNSILQSIKSSVVATYPEASLILYGSYARGDYNEESDLDILVLISKENVTMEDRMKISSSLNTISLNTNMIISPTVYSKQEWANHKVTPFYENVNREGIRL